MTRALAATLDPAETRLRSLLRSLGRPAHELAALLRRLADELDGTIADERHRAEAEVLAERARAAGFTVTPELEVRSHGAAFVLGVEEGTVRNWRAAAAGPPWRRDRVGGAIWYSLPALVAWRRS